MTVDDETQREVEKIESKVAPELSGEDSPIGVDEKDLAERSPRSLRAAVAARIAGASYDEIADLFEYKNAQTARQAVEMAIAGAYEDSNDVDAVRGVINARLESMLRSVAPKALSDKMTVKHKDGTTEIVENPEHIVYVRTMLMIVDRMARLSGADAPQVHRFETPDVARLNEIVASVVTARNQLQAAEADIFDAEIVEDEDEQREAS